MFREAITKTPFSTPEASELFPHISGAPDQGDISFVSTMRAYLAPRMQEGEHIELRLTHHSIKLEELDGKKPAGVLAPYLVSGSLTDSIIIYNIRGDDDACEKFFGVVDKNYQEKTGFTYATLINERLKKTMRFSSFISTEARSVVIFVENLGLQKYHLIQSVLPAFLPWYKERKNTSPDEMPMFLALRNRDANEYRRAIAVLAERYDFRGARIRRELGGFESIRYRSEIERVEANIRQTEERIQGYLESITYETTAKDDLMTRLFGLKYRVSENAESPVMNYFLSNKNIVLDEVNGSEITFSVKSYLAYWDKDLLQVAIRNDRSYLYEVIERVDDYNRDEIVRVLEAIFVEERARVRVCAQYRLGGSYPVGLRHTFDPDEFAGYIANPHINGAQCLGSNRDALAKAISNGEYIGAIEQCFASCRNVNWGDSAIGQYFVECLFGANNSSGSNKCIELPDGSIVDPRGLLEWLDKEEKE